MVGEIPYLLQESTWALRKKHRGTAACQTMQRGLFKTHSYTVFVMAGQDAFARVTFFRTWGECKLKTLNLQISIFPLPMSMIHIADAAAIKVCLRYAYLVGCFRHGSVGDYDLSCQVSQAPTTISGADCLWNKHCGVGRGGMEEVQKDCRSCILRGMSCVAPVVT